MKSGVVIQIRMKEIMIRYLIERIYHYSTYLTSWSWQKLYGDRTKRGSYNVKKNRKGR